MFIAAAVLLILAVLLLKEGSEDAAKIGLLFMVASIAVFAFGVDWMTVISKIPAMADWIFEKTFVYFALFFLGPVFLIRAFFFSKS